MILPTKPSRLATPYLPLFTSIRVGGHDEDLSRVCAVIVLAIASVLCLVTASFSSARVIKPEIVVVVVNAWCDLLLEERVRVCRDCLR